MTTKTDSDTDSHSTNRAKYDSTGTSDTVELKNSALDPSGFAADLRSETEGPAPSAPPALPWTNIVFELSMHALSIIRARLSIVLCFRPFVGLRCGPEKSVSRSSTSHVHFGVGGTDGRDGHGFDTADKGNGDDFDHRFPRVEPLIVRTPPNVMSVGDDDVAPNGGTRTGNAG